MTEMTTSSLMPSRSILRYATTSPGDGGGVWAAATLVCKDCGFEAARSVEGVRRGEGMGEGVSCSLFTRFAGGAVSREVWSGESDFELERCGRELGSCTPREGSESDFLLVL